MTLTADTEANASDKAVAERVRKIREAQDTGVSRAEGWRRRGPLLPALIFMIVVTQIPFLFTLYYSTLSWNLVRPGSRQFVGLNNYIAVVKDSQFWSVALNTVILIVGRRAVSALLGLLLALLLDRAFLGRGVVRTLLITPVPHHARCGSTDLEDHDPRSQQRHPELGALAGRASARSTGSVSSR